MIELVERHRAGIVGQLRSARKRIQYRAMPDSSGSASFTGSVDLASELIGGKALAASDEFFAAKENLLKPGPAVFDPDRYTEFGKWMDGWESRRKRVPGHDHCIIRLGLPGVVHGVDLRPVNVVERKFGARRWRGKSVLPRMYRPRYRQRLDQIDPPAASCAPAPRCGRQPR